ncbi:MAG: hypothetical protein NC182_03880 [Prevotella sp.]|nr:hypothetical protein [Staphylococcus sp.]MCM1350319.1 hypothetical protein [Prevotella sp.]
MKIVFYIKNERLQHYDEVGIYLLSATYQYQSSKLEKQMQQILGVSEAHINGSKDIINENLRAFDAVYHAIDQKMSIQQFKCMAYHQKQDILFYLVQIKGATTDQTFTHLERLSDKDVLYQQTKKVINQYRHKLRKSKQDAVWMAWKAENSVKYYIDRSLDIVALLLSFSIAIAKDNVLSVIICLSIAVLVVGLLRLSITHLEKKRQFQKMCDQVTSVEGKSKQEIIDAVLSHPTAKYKDFIPMYFTYANQDSEIFLYSNQVNKYLVANASKIAVQYQKSKQVLSKDSRRAIAYVVSDKLSQDKSIFNGKLIGIDTDLCFETIDGVVVKPVRYHAYVSTDEMIFKNMMISSDPNYYLAGHKLSLNPVTGGFKDIEHSSLTNLIGVNLIVEVIAEDKHYLILQRQSMYNDVNGNRFVPSASGSLDSRDYHTFQKHKDNDFQTLLQYGMYRELQEECYIDANRYEDTYFQLLGCARLMSKAGKPDFFGKLEIKLTSITQLEEMLQNYDTQQNEFVGRKKELESNQMVIVDKESFLKPVKQKNDAVDHVLSPQLRYVKYLLQEESKKA